MQFQVPQFIEVEDKIFGPLTFKQFVYLIGGAGISFVLYVSLPFFFAALLILPVAGFSLALAFYKVNNRPFVSVVESALGYALKNKLYVWKKTANKPSVKKGEAQKPIPLNLQLPKLSDSKLKDLSWSLDVHQNVQ